MPTQINERPMPLFLQCLVVFLNAARAYRAATTLCCAAMLLSTCGMLSASASAEEASSDVNALIAAFDSKDRVHHEYAAIHADLVARGIFTAQFMYVIRLKQPDLYCQPAALQLTGEQIIDILRRAVRKEPKIGTLDTGLGIFRALEDTFPCPK